LASKKIATGVLLLLLLQPDAEAVRVYNCITFLWSEEKKLNLIFLKSLRKKKKSLHPNLLVTYVITLLKIPIFMPCSFVYLSVQFCRVHLSLNNLLWRRSIHYTSDENNRLQTFFSTFLLFGQPARPICESSSKKF
jgi:hypothetical protein